MRRYTCDICGSEIPTKEMNSYHSYVKNKEWSMGRWQDACESCRKSANIIWTREKMRALADAFERAQRKIIPIKVENSMIYKALTSIPKGE
jgi:hypothetical protein